MSTLRQLKRPIPELTVQVSHDEGFVVRGLTPVHVLSLYHRHNGELSELFDRTIASVRDKGAAEPTDVESIVLALMREAPVILAEIIALAAGADPNSNEFEGDVAIASALAFPVQADAVQKVGDLTFTSDMPPGKFLTLVVGLMQKMTGVVSLAA